MSRGGARKGAGAKPVPDHKKKQSLTIRLRPDQIEFIKEQKRGWAAAIIEEFIDIEMKKGAGKMRLYYVEKNDTIKYFHTLSNLENWVGDGYEMYQDFGENEKRIYHQKKNEFSDILAPERLTVGWVDTED